jgi:hypothetical protein
LPAPGAACNTTDIWSSVNPVTPATAVLADSVFVHVGIPAKPGTLYSVTADGSVSTAPPGNSASPSVVAVNPTAAPNCVMELLDVTTSRYSTSPDETGKENVDAAFVAGPVMTTVVFGVPPAPFCATPFL